jgi:serine/threonine-protein kinase
MGEVYRADDTKLGHAVALKFLPRRGVADATNLDRLRAEVRLGRQVSHPNVCRIYDIGESPEGSFIAMEYVDGEDLASLLRRIGRLPPDKALEIARDLSAGLAAAHDLGILHRDLKPANVMIDGRGRARITDFGLAVLASELEGGAGFSGTPTYMAPEQLEGGQVTGRSDIYGLGLILWEIFTGKRLFDGRSIDEIRSQHRVAKPPSLSTAVRGINPEIERIIARCLDEDPAARPASAHAVIASLPGVDPLAAAVAAGETPSPGMVAAAGQTGELRPAVAWPLLIAALTAVLMVAVMASRTTVVGLAPLPKSPDVLDARGREVAERLGYTDPPASIAHEWILDDDYAKYMVGRNPSLDAWKAVAQTRPGVFVFVYRSSTRPMIAWDSERRIAANDPPFVDPGMTRIVLDPVGRLISFEAIPPQKESAPAAAAPDLDALFREASFDRARFRPVAPVWSAPVDVDEKHAWDGTLAEQPGVALHIEAGAYRGRIDWFKIFGPWTAPVPLREPAQPALGRLSLNVLGWVFGLLVIAAVILAIRNLRHGRGDRRGAFRLACVITATTSVALLFRADHMAGPEAWLLITTVAYGQYHILLAKGVWAGTLAWLLYMALEPYVRRKLPQTLIGWSRLLAGRVRDPIVGRDVLIGVLAGAVAVSIFHLERLLPPWFGASAPSPMLPWTSPLASVRHVAFMLLDQVRFLTLYTLVILFIVVVFRAFFRRQSVAVALAWLVFSVGWADAAGTGSIALPLLASGLVASVVLYVLLRWGLLASTVNGAVFGWLSGAPLTLDPTLWYAGRSFLVLAACAALAIYGFVVSLGGKPMFGRPLFEE